MSHAEAVHTLQPAAGATKALIALNRKNLDDKTVVETMGCVFKYREDLHHLRDQVEGRQFNFDALLRTSPEMVS